MIERSMAPCSKQVSNQICLTGFDLRFTVDSVEAKRRFSAVGREQCEADSGFIEVRPQ
jgi:hypothetical protein